MKTLNFLLETEATLKAQLASVLKTRWIVRIKSLSSGSKAKKRRKTELKGFEKDSTFPIEETDVNLASGHLEIQDLWVEMRSELFSLVYCQAQWQLSFECTKDCSPGMSGGLSAPPRVIRAHRVTTLQTCLCCVVL